MSDNYESYLDSGTRLMMDYLASSGADEEERQAVIAAFSEMLAEHIGDSSKIEDNERIMYTTSIRYLDSRVSKVIADSGASYGDYEKAVAFCRRLADLKQLYSTKGWEFPALNNRDISQSEAVLMQRMDATSISSKITATDRRIDQLLVIAQEKLEVKACDEILQLLEDLAADVQVCKQKRTAVPVINNKDTKKVAKKVVSIRKIAEQKEALHQRIYELDAQIHSIVSMPKSTPDNWRTAIVNCQQQMSYLAECSKKQWPKPQLHYEKPDAIITQYNHYLGMCEIDDRIYSAFNSLSSNKQYKNFFADCEKQVLNIETCQKNGWYIPDLKVPNPANVHSVAKGQKVQKDRAKKFKQKLIMAAVIVILIVAGSIFGVIKSREGKIKIPFDSTYAVGMDLNTIYSELESAGFDNITKRPDTSGWMDSNEVLSVSIDNRSDYNKDKYVEPNVSVVITYSSPNRIYVTDILRNWATLPYLDVETILTDAGFTNIVLEEIETADKDKNMMSAGLALNGEVYTNEHCYLPSNAPITLSYYTLKIGIGNGNTEFIGQNYEDVVQDLRDSGFTNVQTEKITTGWAQGNTVVGVTVNNKDDYSSSEAFSPDVKIVVKYSSDDRVDITKSLENWSTKTYDVVQTALKTAGMTNVTVTTRSTTTKSQNLKVASITVNKTAYTDGDCFVQKSAAIVIEYYKLSISVGQSSKEMTANTEGNYSSVITSLKNKGFTDISVYRNNSLFNGWITKEGSIESVSINGQSDFSGTDSFDFDVPIIIVVNTFEKKGCEDITAVWSD